MAPSSRGFSSAPIYLSLSPLPPYLFLPPLKACQLWLRRLGVPTSPRELTFSPPPLALLSHRTELNRWLSRLFFNYNYHPFLSLFQMRPSMGTILGAPHPRPHPQAALQPSQGVLGLEVATRPTIRYPTLHSTITTAAGSSAPPPPRYYTPLVTTTPHPRPLFGTASNRARQILLPQHCQQQAQEGADDQLSTLPRTTLQPITGAAAAGTSRRAGPGAGHFPLSSNRGITVNPVDNYRPTVNSPSHHHMQLHNNSQLGSFSPPQVSSHHPPHPRSTTTTLSSGVRGIGLNNSSSPTNISWRHNFEHGSPLSSTSNVSGYQNVQTEYSDLPGSDLSSQHVYCEIPIAESKMIGSANVYGDISQHNNVFMSNPATPQKVAAVPKNNHHHHHPHTIQFAARKKWRENLNIYGGNNSELLDAGEDTASEIHNLSDLSDDEDKNNLVDDEEAVIETSNSDLSGGGSSTHARHKKRRRQIQKAAQKQQQQRLRKNQVSLGSQGSGGSATKNSSSSTNTNSAAATTTSSTPFVDPSSFDFNGKVTVI